ncbi:FecR family protein [Candidatus Gracilibacteria bacterium]|nr:FecR family protein [Candidatus Gracilibacteria bacterium]
MKKIMSFLSRNKIAVLVTLLTLGLIFIIYSDVSKNNLGADSLSYDKINPYVLVTNGQALIKREKIIKLISGEKNDIIIGDKIITLENSSATIFWPDGSVTRLGEKSSVTISEITFNPHPNPLPGGEGINRVKFNLDSGKSWSNIIRYLDKNSYFIETYENGRLAATVRGTVFEINLTNNYIHSVNHSIAIEDTETKEEYNIPEGEAREIKNILQIVQEKLLEKSWIDWNKNEDLIYINELINKWKNEISKTINDNDLKNLLTNIVDGKSENIDSLKEKIQKITTNKEDYNKVLLNLYQNINFLPNSAKNLEIKNSLREEIINSATGINKQNFIDDFMRLNLFDYFDAVKNKEITTSNKIKSNIEKYLKQDKNSQTIKKILNSFDKKKVEEINSKFSGISSATKDIIDKLKDKNIGEEFQAQTQKDLEKATGIFGGFVDKIKNYFVK